ncbi:hypothetical protein [Microbacterium fluvii]|nr:hypothetical protein [Microbacterium fluvii]MCU4673754.1 hypothetical protein [Microbacterium fluvii]
MGDVELGFRLDFLTMKTCDADVLRLPARAACLISNDAEFAPG